MLLKTSLYCGMICCSCWAAAVCGQESPSKEQAALVDGLLELLNEPDRDTNQPAAAAPTAPAPHRGTNSGNLAPATAHPLQTVRDNMLTAAGYLSKGHVNQQTQQLQSEIVLSLDELIAQLQQENPPQQSQRQQEQLQQQQSQSSQQQQTPSSPTQPQNSNSAAAEPSRENIEEPGASPNDESPATPGQQGKGANPTVDLADPKTLQQDVWGQLPEQIRKQMQSRMVERFLPSYRQQIEAYFQALIEGEE